MEKKWLRGMFLGVSLALLLAGGVALAQQELTASIDKDCLPCWSGPWGEGAAQDPTAEYVAKVTISNINPQAYLCMRATTRPFQDEICSPEAFGASTATLSLAAGCDEELCFWEGKLSGAPDLCVNSSHLGQWWLGFWQEEFSSSTSAQPLDVLEAEVTFELAQVCEVEFVPEPGTIALLGTGLAGLAGYAALRWRARR